MPVTVVVGGQFGSEGKGKTALFRAREMEASFAVRVGGSNSGHTAYDGNRVCHTFRHLPTAVLLPGTTCVLGPGSLIDPDVLRGEVERIGLSRERLIVDPCAFVITEEHRQREEQLRFEGHIGSTLSGTGEALVDRLRRRSPLNLAREHPYLSQFVSGPVRTILRRSLARGERIVVEGTQGFGLSNLQSRDYPYATSRDTTAATFVAEASLSPLDVDEIVLVVRAFPIRVSGNSGPLPSETDWPTISREGGHMGLEERTTVTKRIRRVARFDPEVVRAAIEANAPTKLILNHVDYFDSKVAGAGRITSRALGKVEDIESRIGRRFDWLGTSPWSFIPRASTRHEEQENLPATGAADRHAA